MKASYEELEKKIKILEKKIEKFNLSKKESNNNSFLTVLFDTIPNPMFFKNTDGIYLHCNNIFSETILGLKRKEVLGKSFYDLPSFIPDEYAEIYHEKDKELFDTNETQIYETKVKCADGTIKSFNFYKTAIMQDKKVTGLVGIMLDVSTYEKTLKSLEEKNKLLNDLTITDYLTALYNRRHFEEIFTQKLGLLNRMKHKFHFALIDIDYFKAFNDTFGHSYGDIVLRQVSDVIKEVFSRTNDFCFRIGGEEFAIIFEVKSPADALKISQDLLTKIENLKIKTANTTVSKYLTVSLGLGHLEKINKTVNNQMIYNEVDTLLYKSKSIGRNKISSKNIYYK